MVQVYFNGIIKILKDHQRVGDLQQVTDMVPVIDMDYGSIWIYVSVHWSYSLHKFIIYFFIQKRLMLKLKSTMANAFLIRPKSSLLQF